MSFLTLIVKYKFKVPLLPCNQLTAKSNIKLSKYATPIFIGVYKQLFYIVNI